MKVLFTIMVLIAGIYLILPKEHLEKLALFLPKNQIEKAAQVVLTDVDKKLEIFKAEHLLQKNSRINKLEKQLAKLQAQVIAQDEKYKLSEIKHNEQVLQWLAAEKRLTVEKTLAQNEYASAEPSFTHAKQLVANKVELSPKQTDIVLLAKPTDKEKAVKRQAYLQDLVERMNKTSLLTLTN